MKKLQNVVDGIPYLNFISITDNSKLDMNEINSLLKKIQNEIKFEDNMVKYEMNNF